MLFPVVINISVKFVLSCILFFKQLWKVLKTFRTNAFVLLFSRIVITVCVELQVIFGTEYI